MIEVPENLTLSEASQLLHAKKLSAETLVKFYLDAIATHDDAIRAWVLVDADGALAHARRLDQLLSTGTWLGPLHGIPIGVKDIYDVEGLPSEAGSSLRKGAVAVRDAVSVRNLKQAGAIVLGKTVTTELGHSVPGPTRNPWNTSCTPGGSSSGSAAAVAAGMCMGALGSQTLGSIIRPAAFCGVVGIKGTAGRICRNGILPLASTLDTPGPMARTVRDAVTLFEAMAGTQSTEFVANPVNALDVSLRSSSSRPTIGIPSDYFTSIDSDMQARLAEALNCLKDLGFKVIDVPMPDSFRPVVSAAQVVVHVEAATLHVDLYSKRPKEYSSEFRRTIERGLMVPAASYVRAQQLRQRALCDMRDLFQRLNLDVLVTPAAMGIAPTGLGSTGDPSFNTPFTALGMPVLTVPMGFVRGMPVGLQVAGLPDADGKVVAVGAKYEDSTAWHKQRPPLRSCEPV